MATMESIAQNGSDGNDMPSQLKQRRQASQLHRINPSPGGHIDSSPSSPLTPEDRKASLRADSFRTSSSSFDHKPFNLRASTGDLLNPRATEEEEDTQLETSIWHSIPLLLAIVPAIGGLAFKSGSVLLTDLSLLGLSAIYLNWFLVTPWTWYHSARSVNIIQPIENDIALDDSDEEDSGEETAGELSRDKPKELKKAVHKRKSNAEVRGAKEIAATKELHLQEILALLMCFIGPVLGAYLLHIIRGSLSQVGHQLVSDLHLTLFVLGAELRPMRHAVKLIHARTLFLQRTVKAEGYANRSAQIAHPGAIGHLSIRMDELEVSFSNLASQPVPELNSSTSESTEQFRKGHSALQTQIDALNRAVRRYEKRATAQTMQTEARLQDLENRLGDALSLAAVAAKYAQKPGFLAVVLEQLASLFLMPLKIARASVVYPARLINNVTTDIMVRLGIVASQYQDASMLKQRSYMKSSRDSAFARRPKT